MSFESSGTYSYSGNVVGTNNVKDLSDSSRTKGLVTNYPGWIIIKLNGEWEFDEIVIGGYQGNTGAFAADNGGGATIETSKDNLKWTNVGTIPSGFGYANLTVKLTKSSARFIKFTSTSYLGIGYLEIKRK